MTPAERRVRDRRATNDRRVLADDLPSRHLGVTRREYENLCRQIDELMPMLQRIENDLSQQAYRIDQLGYRFSAIVARALCVNSEKSL